MTIKFKTGNNEIKLDNFVVKFRSILFLTAEVCSLTAVFAKVRKNGFLKSLHLPENMELRIGCKRIKFVPNDPESLY